MNWIEQLLHEHDDYREARHLVSIEGLSTPRVCNLLNGLVARLSPGETYLEIGTWKGLTVCSAALGNRDKRVVACDKFSLWGKTTGFGPLVRRALRRNIARYADRSAPIEFHALDSRSLFARGLVADGVKVYFYDGDHSFEGTKHGIVAAAPLLCDESYLIVDDWNARTVREATYEGLDAAGLKIVWERYLVGENGDQQGWWNGLGAFHLRKRA